MITPDQIKAARKLLGWSAATLAKKAGWGLLTVAKAESATLQPEKVEKILARLQAAFETAGVEFVHGGVRLSERPPLASTTITAAQIKEARRLLGWSLNTLARTAGVGVHTVENAQKSALVPRYAEQQLAAIRNAFETAGIEFTGDRATIKFGTGEGSPPASSARMDRRKK